MNKPDLSVFVGSGFDMEFSSRKNFKGFVITAAIASVDYFDSLPFLLEFQNHTQTEMEFCRPRLNKPQVLDDYSFIESLEGFVWDVMFEQNVCFGDMDETARTHLIKNQCVHESSPYVEWARANDVPVLNDAGKVL